MSSVVPLISFITPTFERPSFLESCYRTVCAQTYPNWEWRVLDDSAAPSPFLQSLDAPNVFYNHVPGRRGIGEKRNLLVAAAKGEVVVQFDDDDYYAPGYAAFMVAALERNAADLVNLNAWFLLDRRNRFFGYWDLLTKNEPAYCCSPAGVQAAPPTPELVRSLAQAHFGFGFTYAFRKRVWEAGPFPTIDWNEDGEFALAARRRFRMVGMPDDHGLCVHVLHRSNTSQCFPQYRLPYFVLERLFPNLPPSPGAVV